MLGGKRLELVVELLGHRPAKVAWLSDPEAVSAKSNLAARHRLPDIYELREYVVAVMKERPDALLVPSSPRFSPERQQIVAAIARRRIPAMYEWGDIARAGGLIAYGPVFAELQRLVAGYVDRILKGANPADLPVAQPKRFELVLNLKTATALGLTVPPSIFLQADEVIE